MHKTFAWNSITGAVLVRQRAGDEQEGARELARAEEFLGGAIDVEKIKAMRGTMATIHIGYRDERNRLRHEQVPVLIRRSSANAGLGKRRINVQSTENSIQLQGSSKGSSTCLQFSEYSPQLQRSDSVAWLRLR